MLQERNKSYQSIKFVDISSDDYSAQDNQGLDYETVCSLLYFISSKLIWFFSILRHYFSS